MKKLRRRKIANGRPKAVWNRIRPSVGVEDAERVVELEHRDQRHLQRHHEQRHDADEQPVAAGELEPRERIAGEARRSRIGSTVPPTAMITVVYSADMIASLSNTVW